MGIKSILSLDLSSVEEIILSKLSSEAKVFNEVSSYLHALGGKRIRPSLTLMTGECLGMQQPFEDHEAGRQLLQVAAGIELIHMATLLHDDIIDKSPRRRHKDSPWIKFGLEPSLLTGDFLLSRAFGICGLLDDFIIRATERACVALTEGEVLETPLFKQNHSLESYIDIAGKKTGALFQLATESAAHLSGLTGEVLGSMSDFGRLLGIAFQMVDDILDVDSSESSLGKPVGQDIREAKPSLVNILWLESGSRAAGILTAPPSAARGEDAIAAAVEEIRASPSILPKARSITRDFIRAASASMDRAGSALHSADFGKLRKLINFVEERAS